MSQISKCPKVTVILRYLEVSGEVSKLRYKSLLYSSSNGSYCSCHLGKIAEGGENALEGEAEPKHHHYNALLVLPFAFIAYCLLCLYCLMPVLPILPVARNISVDCRMPVLSIVYIAFCLYCILPMTIACIACCQKDFG